MAGKDALTKTYICKTRINHDGEDYAEGDEITLGGKHAKPLLDVNAIEPKPEEAEADTSKTTATAPAGKTAAAGRK